MLKYPSSTPEYPVAIVFSCSQSLRSRGLPRRLLRMKYVKVVSIFFFFFQTSAEFKTGRKNERASAEFMPGEYSLSLSRRPMSYWKFAKRRPAEYKVTLSCRTRLLNSKNKSGEKARWVEIWAGWDQRCIAAWLHSRVKRYGTFTCKPRVVVTSFDLNWLFVWKHNCFPRSWV